LKYEDFIKKKQVVDNPCGFNWENINPILFDFQKDIVRWAIKRGRAAIFADCGLGKSFMQIEWAKAVSSVGNVLILAPLAVSQQTKREGEKLGVDINLCRSQEDVNNGINITNYEMLHKFDLSKFAGIVLDESSILKNFTGKIRNQIISSTKQMKYKLACTATPAPNDHMELGNHSEFLGAMSREEMLSMFFVHDGGDTSKWRLKGHAEESFWRWVCSWAVNIRKPSDLGYDDNNFKLPGIEYHHHVVKKERAQDGLLFPVEALTLSERQQERKATIEDRCKKAAEIINGINDPCIVWCNLNDESKMISSMVSDCREVTGSDKNEKKERDMLEFTENNFKCLVSKPKIAGLGMNWQHCSNVFFVGLSDSYEQYYQAVRRCYRFGQTKTVNVHIITAETEGAVVKNIQRKEEDAKIMADSMVKHMADINSKNIKQLTQDKTEYLPQEQMIKPSFL
jgi:superfamily II DNA or RNA helicase